MLNNHHEGHGGFQIIPIGLTGKPDYALRPNVVLLLAGTNDIVFGVDVANAPRRLGDVAKEVTENCPDSVVLVGTLTPLLNPGWASKVGEFNERLPPIIRDLAKEGKRVEIVPMSRVNASHLHSDDGIHPTDEGYKMIASAWYDSVLAAAKKGWISKPLSIPDSEGQLPLSDDAGNVQEIAIETPPRRKLIEEPSTQSLAYQYRFLVYAVLLCSGFLAARKVIGVLLRRYGA